MLKRPIVLGDHVLKNKMHGPDPIAKGGFSVYIGP
jgi:hypothetical protein